MTSTFTSAVTTTSAPPARPLATCSPGVLDWSVNSRGQSPCFVASTIGGVCFDSAYTLTQLPPEGDYHYRGISSERGEDTPCLCNTVYYSLEAACAACQHPLNSWDRWTYWSTNCTATYPTYPRPIPPSVAIPAWAYLDVTAGNTFNITLAQSFAALPDSTALPQPTSTSTSTSTTTRRTITSTSSTQPRTSPAITSPAVDPPAKQNNIAAIVGGVVGGLAAILLAVILTMCLLRRRSKKSHGSVPPMVSALSTGTTLQPPQSPMSYESSHPFSDGKPSTPMAPNPYTYPATPPFDGNQMQYTPQSLPYSGRPTSYSASGFPSNPVIGQTYYKGIPETM